MLVIQVGDAEVYDEKLEEFRTLRGFKIELEHSLVSLSKWESNFEKPFLSTTEKTDEEVLYYVGCMITSRNFPRDVLSRLTPKHIQQVNEYINAKMTATWVNERKQQAPNRETITSELIYYWMIALQIPFECQHWHLNRLLMLVKVCNHKNTPPKQMGKRELAQRNRELNAQRRAKYGTKG